MFSLEKFIEDIKSYKELYDKRNLYYSDVMRKNKIWEKLNEKYGIDAKAKWTYLRDKYVREKKKMDQPSGAAATHKKLWEMLPLMDFLDDTIQPRRMRENVADEKSSIFGGTDFSFSTEVSDLINGSQESEIDDLTTNSAISTSDQLLGSNDYPKKRKEEKTTSQRKNQNIDNLFAEAVNSFKRKMEENSQVTSYSADEEDDFFLKSIACKMRKMLPAAKREFKIKLLIEADQFSETYN